MDLQSFAPADGVGRLRREVALHLLAAAALAITLAGAIAYGLAGLPGPASPAGYVPASLAVFLLVAGSAWKDLPRHAHHGRWGDANRVTLLRGVMISLVGGTLPLAASLPGAALWALGGLALAALAMDGLDGWIARRQHLQSDYGARFDMGLDTLLTLVLALLVWVRGETGVWVLLAGTLRHLFVLAGMALPWLTAPLPYSARRRVVCVVQILVLALAVTPLLDPPFAAWACAGALGLLLFSFGRDTVWLYCHRPSHPPPA